MLERKKYFIVIRDDYSVIRDDFCDIFCDSWWQTFASDPCNSNAISHSLTAYKWFFSLEGKSMDIVTMFLPATWIPAAVMQLCTFYRNRSSVDDLKEERYCVAVAAHYKNNSIM